MKGFTMDEYKYYATFREDCALRGYGVGIRAETIEDARRMAESVFPKNIARVMGVDDVCDGVNNCPRTFAEIYEEDGEIYMEHFDWCR